MSAAIGVGLLAAGPAGVASAPPAAPQRARAPQVPTIEVPGDYRLAAMTAEDNRLRLPDDLHTPIIDSLRLRTGEDIRVLLALARPTSVSAQARAARPRAIRSLGRYESREFITELLTFLDDPQLRSETAHALYLSLRGEPLPADTGGQQVDAVLGALVTTAKLHKDSSLWAPFARPVGRLPYTRAEQVRAADAFLLEGLHRAEPELNADSTILQIARAAEYLARLHGRLAPLGERTVERLQRIVRRFGRTRRVDVRRNALAALIAARALDLETLRIAVADGDDQIRRLATLSLAGAGSEASPEERQDFLRTLLSDRSALIRYEAVRAWARTQTAAEGCERLLEALRDDSSYVVLMTIDLLPAQCPTDVNITDWLTAEARALPVMGNWHKASHALVALARRAPERALIPLTAHHMSHDNWLVRMYAARAAAILNEVTILERLALDKHDNVREVTLAPLRRLKGAEAEPHFVAALRRDDYQLLRTAAIELKGATPTTQLVEGLLGALLRVTAEQKETSRDTRMALLERLGDMGNADYAERLAPLLRDFDIEIAMRAGAVIEGWTGKPAEVDPRPLNRPLLPLPGEIDVQVMAVVEMENGKKFQVIFDTSQAPLAFTRFTRLVRAGYYNGLTFHRVLPNFIVQGGSPGANEYVGDGPFMRDEFSPLMSTRGTIGISTRGRDTGDAQFFINMVDNPRLDYDYTIFAKVCNGMDVVEAILEGDRITRIRLEKQDPDCR